MYITPDKTAIFVHYSVNMEATDLLSYKAISKLLTGNDNSIRKNRCPKRYKDQIIELEAIVNYWIHKHKPDK